MPNRLVAGLPKRVPKLFVISSPSGGGKTTVVRHVLRMTPNLVRSVSVTTRAPRKGERQGVAYRFVSEPEFHQLQRQGELLEWARVHRAYYGTPLQPLRAAAARGHDVMLSIDVQGARQARRRLGSRAVLIFLVPPSKTALFERLRRRGTEPTAAIRQRLHAASRELACVRWYDYAIINQRLKGAVQHVKAIIAAERLRIHRPPRAGVVV